MQDERGDLERITQIIEDQIKLERHQRKRKKSQKDIDFQRLDAYRQIVQLLTGHDNFIDDL